MSYKEWTIKELIAELKSCAKQLPKGLNSRVTMGDFECNFLHGMFEPQLDISVNRSDVCLGYEMHETIEEW